MASSAADRPTSGRPRPRVLRVAPLVLAVCGALAVVVLGTGAASAAPTATGVPSRAPSDPGPSPSPTVPPSTPPPGTIVKADFEDGTTDGFVGDPASVSVTTTPVDGSVRLSVRGLTGYGQGARLTLPAGLPAGYYGATARVRLSSGERQDVRIVLPDSPRVTAIQTGISRSVATGWGAAINY